MDPRVPFTAAEEVVDFDAHQEHILDQRERVERSAWNDARRFSHSVYLNDGIPSHRAASDLAARLVASVTATYVFGYRSAHREIASLRARRGGRPGLIPAPAGNPPAQHMREVVGLAHEATSAYAKSVVRAWETRREDLEWLERRSRVLLHNAVLELVGRALNLGRTHAAVGGEMPKALTADVAPALWAMRSEQLDTNTCPPCDQLHGRVVQLLSPEYLEYLPPNLCLGRGRCRGIYVYSDDPADFASEPGQQRIESIA